MSPISLRICKLDLTDILIKLLIDWLAVFRIFLSSANTVFLVSPKKLHPAVGLKRFCQEPLIRRKHDKPSVFSNHYLGRNGCQADYEKLKITLKEKTISEISRGWDNILWTSLALECGLSSFYSLIASSLSPLFVAGIILLSPASFTWNNSKGDTVYLVVKKCSLVVRLRAAIVPTQTNILTMTIKNQLQNVAFRFF